MTLSTARSTTSVLQIRKVDLPTRRKHPPSYFDRPTKPHKFQCTIIDLCHAVRQTDDSQHSSLSADNAKPRKEGSSTLMLHFKKIRHSVDFYLSGFTSKVHISALSCPGPRVPTYFCTSIESRDIPFHVETWASLGNHQITTFERQEHDKTSRSDKAKNRIVESGHRVSAR